jgi:phage-related protein
MFFDIFARDKDASKTLERVGGTGEKLGKTMSGVGSIVEGIGIAEVFKTGEEKIADTQRITAQLEAGLKSTGGVAGVTKEGMLELANSISEYSGQTNDSIANTESLLLTFTNIKNVGPDKIFDETTKAAADMAAKMGGEASDKAIILGKALNDPTAGLTALRRVGVSFTEDQQKQIKAMQASGDTMGAQKVILAELSKEFGGAAEAAGNTMPGELNKAKNSFAEVSGQLVTGLLPMLTELLHGVENVITWFKNLSPEMKNVVIAILAVAGAAMALNAVLDMNPFVLIIIGIAALVAGLIWAYNSVGWFKDFVNVAFAVIRVVVTAVINWITGTLVPAFVGAWHIVSTVIVWLYTNIFQPYFNMIFTVISAVVTWIMGTAVPFVTSAFQNIGSAVSGVVHFFVDFYNNVSDWVGKAIDFVGSVPGKIMGFFANAGGWLLDIGSKIIGGLIKGVQDALGGLGDVLGNVGKFIADHKGPEAYDKELLVPHGGWIMGGLIRGITGHIPTLQGVLGDVTNAISGGIGGGGLLGVAGGGGGSGTWILQVGDREFEAYLQDTTTGAVARSLGGLRR